MNKTLLTIIERITTVQASPSIIQIGYTVNNICRSNGFVILNSSSKIISTVYEAVEELKKNENSKIIMIEMSQENKGLLVYMF